MLEEYIKTGKVYFVYHDLPLIDIHPYALQAAHFASCAGDQGQFWEMHARIFAGYETKDWGGADDFKIFVGYGRELGLDLSQLQDCVNANTHADRFNRDRMLATQNGIRSTPSFLINGQPFVGAQPYNRWKQVLDRLLAQQ